MNTIEVANLYKRFNYHPIIKDFSFSFQSRMKYAVKGSNGSGKSTLINLLTGYLSPSAGTIQYKIENKSIHRNDIYKYIGIASPYTSLIQDFSLEENFDFFTKFKELQIKVTYKDLLDMLEWKDPMDKPYSKFSSGMKQKAVLALVFLSASPILFLDEPTSFLDLKAKEWYRENFQKFNSHKLVVIASNDEVDFVDIVQEIEL